MHVDKEDKQNPQNAGFESPRGMTIINESCLYSLILSSKLPQAREFKHWVKPRGHHGQRRPDNTNEPLVDRGESRTAFAG